jgi:hypothetical protein
MKSHLVPHPVLSNVEIAFSAIYLARFVTSRRGRALLMAYSVNHQLYEEDTTLSVGAACTCNFHTRAINQLELH